MRALLCTILLSLLLPSAADARQKTELAGGDHVVREDGLVGTVWDCDETLIDERGRKGGVAACLRAVLMDPASGRSAALVEVLVDHEDVAVPDLEYTLKLDAGRTERHLSGFGVAALHGDGGGPGELPVLAAAAELATEHSEGWAELEIEEEAHFGTVAWEFQSWDPSIGLKHIQLKVRGSGLASGFRWKMEEPLVHEGDWGGRPELVWDAEWAAEEPTCSAQRVRPKHLGDLVDGLDDGAATLPLQLRFVLDGVSEKSSMDLDFPDHKVRLEIDGGKLRLIGRERFVRPIDEDLLESGQLPVEVVYDGRFITVRAGDETYGPMDARRRDTGRFRWDFDFGEGRQELLDVFATPCELEDEDRYADDRSKEPAGPPEEVVASTPTAASAGGAAVVAVLSVDGRRLAEPKRKKSALEVAAGALTVAQGIGAVADAGRQFGQDVQGNLDAMESGNYEDMKSSSTRVDIGPGGVTTTRSEARVTPNADGGVDLEMQSETRTQASPNAMLGLTPGADGGLPQGRSAGRVMTLELLAAGPWTLDIGGDALGPFAGPGSRWLVQVKPGSHALVLRDGDTELATGTLRAVAGASARIELTSTGFEASAAGVLAR